MLILSVFLPKTNLFYRTLWSIYFLFSIGIIGLIMGYAFSLPAYLLIMITTPFPALSLKIRHWTENIYCSSIRFLLVLQPWLKCTSNFPNIFNFYSSFSSRKILFVGNHRSNLDTFLLISYIPGLRGLAKQSLFYNFLFAPIMLLTGFVPVQKGSAASFLKGLDTMKQKILNKNRPALVFPENTRCEKNSFGLGKMTTSFFSLAIDAKALVVPIAIHNSDAVMGRGDLLIHPGHIRVQMLPAIDSSIFPSAKQLCEAVQLQILGALRDA